MKRAYSTRLVLLLGVLAGCTGLARTPGGADALGPAEQGVREFVQQVCEQEFRGHAERYDFAVLTPKRSKELERQGWELPLVFDGPFSPFVVVTSYQLQSVSVKGTSAVATVRYQVVAESDGAAVMRPAKATTQDVRLTLELRAGKWWVVDPPAAHVGLQALIDVHERELALYRAPGWEEGAGEPAKKTRALLESNVAKLRRMKAEHDGAR